MILIRQSTRIHRRIIAVTVLGLVFGAIAACSGGGGSGGGLSSFALQVTATSFQSTPTSPGGSAPTIFRDEALILTFGASIDAGLFGGFVSAPGSTAPVVNIARSAQSPAGVPYHAYVDQAAAHASIQLWNDATAVQYTAAIIGRVVANPNQIVIDPVVSPTNPHGLAASLGYPANTQFDLFIPSNGGLRILGRSAAAFGGLPPQAPPPYQATASAGAVAFTGSFTLLDVVAPTVVEITTIALLGASPTTPIAASDTIRVTFSEPIDPASVDPIQNLIVRNKSVTTALEPQGVIVPTTITSDATFTTYFLSPIPSFGPGLSPTVGFEIQVLVGANTSAAFDLRDLPSGPSGNQNGLVGVATATFTTIPDVNATQGLSLTETFATTAAAESAFAGRYNTAGWNVGGSGRLEGTPISGSTIPGQSLGTRQQFAIQPTSPPPVTAYFSPFDDNALNNFGASVNPQGGSRTQFLYNTNSPELPDGLTDTIEAVEWGGAFPFGVPFAATYNGFSMAMSHTTASASSAATFGLSAVYALNFDFDNPQNAVLQPTSHPAGLPLNEAAILVIPPQPYVVPVLASAFVPFPAFATLFDVDDGGRTESSAATGFLVEPNIVLDINIPAPVAPTGNFIFGNFPLQPVPVRRLTGGPGALQAANADNVASHMRFTIVARHSSMRSLPYDAGALQADPDYVALTFSPSVAARPAGTVLIVRAEAADAFVAGVAQTVGATAPTGLRTLVDRGGNFSATEFNALDDRRFIRFQFEFESNTLTNQTPFIDAFQLIYTP